MEFPWGYFSVTQPNLELGDETYYLIFQWTNQNFYQSGSHESSRCKNELSTFLLILAAGDDKTRWDKTLYKVFFSPHEDHIKLTFSDS